MKVSVAVLYDSEPGEFIATPKKPRCPALLKRLGELELVIGFNQMRFDYRVVCATPVRTCAALPNLDLMLDVQEALGHRLSLDALAKATLGAAKTADGLQAVAWWEAGEMAKLTAYCQADVEITRDLFLFGQREGVSALRAQGRPAAAHPGGLVLAGHPGQAGAVGRELRVKKEGGEG